MSPPSLFPVLLSLLLPACAANSGHVGSWIDLSHDYSTETIYWPTASGFELRQDSKGQNPKGYWYEANTVTTAEHGGTHIDAPVHFAKDQLTVDRIPIDQLAGTAVVLDVTERVKRDRDYQVRIEDVMAFEEQTERIPNGAIVLIRTGFGDLWPDREQYLGTAERGQEAALKLHFPGLHPSTAKWLLNERAIRAVGIDTASIDYGQSRLFHSHRELFKHNVPAFENVANLDQLPRTGAWVIALPMKIRGGSGAPLRIVALVTD